VSGTEAAGRLAAMIADLEGFIDRRAEDLAAPLIEEARAEAARQVAVARQKAERKEDLIAEYRRQVKVMERQLDAWQDATGSLNPDAVRPADDPAVLAAWNGASLELLIRAAEFIGPRSSLASPGMLSRRLGISYQHAGEVLDLLHAEGIVGPARAGWKTREVLEQHDRHWRRCAPCNLRPPDPNWPGNPRPEPTHPSSGPSVAHTLRLAVAIGVPGSPRVQPD
jgi:hypothetical protein